ncbi:MAG: DNA recombination protein RmuC [Spirochaetes bacterium]|nr:DNA recombination protein RmuC [Brevinematales bacterium]MCL1959424.1 DNA recombination protein RmuC [Spirochaetota bacterium]
MDLITLGAFAVLFLLVILILIKLYSNKTADYSAQMIDLKNQIGELKTKQLESQQVSLTSQQKLLTDTQNNLNTQLQQMMNIMNQNLNSTQSNITKQLSSSNQIIGDINSKLGSLETTAKNIQNIGKDISSLQNILQAPKLRGNLGEYLLEDLLKQIFPSANYKIKHSFKNGTQVDAVIKLGENIVPVDSKFPLESFQKFIAADNDEDKKLFRKDFITSVKKRIDEITSKYINPAEGTYDFAIMYIPAENVYYETIINDSFTNKDYELLNYAMEKHVIPVSPNSFYAYLMAISFGLNGLKIEQDAKIILGELSQIQNRFGKFYEEYGVVGKHLNSAVGKYNETTKTAEKLNDQISKITEQKTELIEG